MREIARQHALDLATFPSAEAQVAALSDEIAYNAHDIDDGLRAKLFDVIDLGDLPLAGEALAEVLSAYPEDRSLPGGSRDGSPDHLLDGARCRDRDRNGASPAAKPASADDVRSLRRTARFVFLAAERKESGRAVVPGGANVQA